MRNLRLLASLTLALPLGLFFAGCSKSSHHHSGSTTAGVTSSTTGKVPPPGAGPLAQKAHAFETLMEARHTPLGQVQDVRLDANGNVVRMGGAPSRCLWTGLYIGAEAQRYRVTGDPAALSQLERAMQALHDLHEITGKPGVIARGYDDPAIETHGWPGSGRFAGYNYNSGKTSRDQYAGWFYGVGMGYDLIQDPALRQAIADDVRAVADRLIAGNLQLKTPWGPQNKDTVFFNLRPDNFYQDQINAQTWATIDDFPFNLIVKSVPYDAQLADAIKNAPMPPLRAGEALRAVFFFTVAEHVTGDVRYGDFKRELLYQRGYLQDIQDYVTIIDDVFYGRNTAVVEATLRQLFNAIGTVLQAYLVATGKSTLVTQVLVPVLSRTISTWLSNLLTDALTWLHNPTNQTAIQNVVARARVAVLLLGALGKQQLATKLDALLTTYGPTLTHQGMIDFARTVRSHLGANLTALPLVAMMRLERDPQLVDAYKQIVDKYWYYLSTDHNPVVDLVHAGFGVVPGANDVPDSLQALRNYPVDMSLREVDNSNWPGLVVSPWPDRLGKKGNIALYPDYFPIDHRAPDIFPWRGHPRQIKSGSNNPSVQVAPLGYLIPYWLGRDLGTISAAD